MKKVCTGPLEFTPYRPWTNERKEDARTTMAMLALLDSGRIKIDAKKIKKTVADIWEMTEVYDETIDVHRAGLFLITSTKVYPKASIIARASGLAARECTLFYRRAKEGGLTLDGRSNDWMDLSIPESQVAFMCDCMIVAGEISSRAEFDE